MTFLTIFSPDGAILWVNGTIPPTKPEEIIGIPIWEFSSIESERELVRSHFERCISGKISTYQTAVELDGKTYLFNVILYPTFGISGIGGVAETVMLAKGHSELTNRESQVIDMIASGMYPKEIASTLGLTHSTVKTHLRNSAKKLGMKDMWELTAYCSRKLRHVRLRVDVMKTAISRNSKSKSTEG